MKTKHGGFAQLSGLIAGSVALVALLVLLHYRRARPPEASLQADAPLAPAPPTTSADAAPARRPEPQFELAGPAGSRRLLHYELPAYPAWAEDQGVTGKVRLRFRVNQEGEVYPNVWVDQTMGHPEFDEAAVRALRHWKFSPARQPALSGYERDRRSEASPGQPGVVNFVFTL